MPRASTPRSARQARTAADPLLRKPQVVIQTVPKKNIVAKVGPPQKPAKTPDSVSSAKKWVASPVTTTPATPDKDAPWRHPAELEYITPPLSDDEIIAILIKNGFSVPPRPRASKDPWTKITSWDGQTVTTIPRLYRLPLMFSAKFQWQSLKLVMASENREKEWEEYKHDILHVSRLCAKFLEEAREAKTQMLLNKEWKCHTFDRAIIRYYQKWMLSRDEFVKEFWYEFDEDEYRKNVFELNWHKFVLEGHKGFNLTKEEIMNGLTFEDFTEGCGFVDGRVKWGTSSNTASATVEQENVLGSSDLSPSSNGVSADPIGRLRPRIDKLSLEVKREMLDDSISVTSTSSSLSPAPSSPYFSPADALRGASEDREDHTDRTLPYPGLIRNAQSQSPVTSPSTLTAVTNTQSHATSTDLSSVPSPGSYSVEGTPPVDKDVPMADPVLPTPPPSAPSAPPALLPGIIRRPLDESQIPVTMDTASRPPLDDLEQLVVSEESTEPPQYPLPPVVQNAVNGAAESHASSPPLGDLIRSPIQNSWDAGASTELATPKYSDSLPASNSTSLSTPSSTPLVPTLPASLRRVSPAAVTPPPALDPETPSRPADIKLPPDCDEKELLQSYFQFPDRVDTQAPPEAPQSTDLPPSATPDVVENVETGSGEKESAEEMDTVVQNGDEPAFAPSIVVSPKPELPEKQTSPSSFDISSSRASSADRPSSPNMDISPPPSTRLQDDSPTTRPRSSSDSMDLDNPLAEKVATVLKHTVKGLTELMNSVHQGPTRSSDMSNGVEAVASFSNSTASLSQEPSLADLIGEIRSLRQVIQEESRQKADRDAELRQLKTEMEELRRMLSRSSDDSMSVDSDPPGSRVLHSASYYRRSPSVMTPISAHPLSHLVHADEEPATNGWVGHQRSASGSMIGPGESISSAPRVPSRLTHSSSPSKSLQSPVPENVPFKLKKKHMVFPKASE